MRTENRILVVIHFWLVVISGPLLWFGKDVEHEGLQQMMMLPGFLIGACFVAGLVICLIALCVAASNSFIIHGVSKQAWTDFKRKI
jgi:hypothetical protein